MEEGASLHISLRSAENNIYTRGVEDLDDNGIVSDEEMIVDGRKMYRLALFLLEGNSVVASTVLEANDSRFTSNNTEATVSFTKLDYNKTYQLYAVANYGNYGNIIGDLSYVDAYNLTSGLKVSASSDNICPKNTAYPLTLKQQVTLNPGANAISGQLVRTYARLRINVRNQSVLKNLKVNGLSFPNNFTQSSADIFNEGGISNVKPTVNSTNAITPFQTNMMIPKIDEKGYVTESTLFDTYLLESNNGNYNYTLNLSLEDDPQHIDNIGNSITHNETIPIRIIDKTNGEVTPLTKIRRNDFINILVKVSYNEKIGKVEFDVSNWDEVNGEVTFD